MERLKGTDQHRNARKARKTYRFSKDWRFHEALIYLTLYSYNFCWPVRTLRTKDESGRWVERSPAMAAGLPDHVWSMSEWIKVPGGATQLGHEAEVRESRFLGGRHTADPSTISCVGHSRVCGKLQG